ncbi:MAG: AAA family ATPase [Fimbriimonadaceae bacterium]|nr:AAA family ATPase [Fimbriimonadaceae bacterium]
MTASEYRTVNLISATDVTDDVPTWAWEYNGKGRIQLGTLALFAGRPGAGKSTAARWFAAGFTNGTLAGRWCGKPQNVAYIAPAEESLKYIVKPGLRAAGADLSRIYFPEVWHDDKQVRLQSDLDEARLTEEIVAAGITIVVVDPLMDTISASTDIHRNNEVRACIDPWARIAAKIDGIVIGVAHLKKAATGDVVAGVNGSSAFGEVPRAVFGFAKDPATDDDRIMSQEKNSTGEEDLALTYRIESHPVTTDSANVAEVGRFVIIGESDRTVGDVLREAKPPAASDAQIWLEDYLTEHGTAPSRDVKETGKAEGFSGSAIDRAARNLKVAITTSNAFPRHTLWSLPRSRQSRQSPRVQVVRDATDVTVDNCPGCGGPLGATTGNCAYCIASEANRIAAKANEADDTNAAMV